ncbi:MAG: TfoX/Sxy family protein [Parvibaculum sp.]
MSVSAEFLEFVTEQMAGFGPVSVRRMFGGAGVFRDGLMFALIADEALYFKADASSESAFKAEGLGPFTYQTRHNPRTVMSYWRAPERCLDDPDEMADLCRKAYAVALKSAKPAKGSSG